MSKHSFETFPVIDDMVQVIPNSIPGTHTMITSAEFLDYPAIMVGGRPSVGAHSIDANSSITGVDYGTKYNGIGQSFNIFTCPCTCDRCN